MRKNSTLKNPGRYTGRPSTRYRDRVVRRSRPQLSQRLRDLRTLSVLIPRYYNADGQGVRNRVERSKLLDTMNEIKQYFSGYICTAVDGWQKDKLIPGGCTDKHWSFEIDVVFSSTLAIFLQKWKQKLRRRFAQKEIFMRLSSRVTWL